MAKQITYREQEKIQNTMKLREFLSELPPYAKDYFRAKEPTTSDKTRLSYAYDLRVFFRFLQESNPNLKEKQISEISLSDLSALQPVDFEELHESSPACVVFTNISVNVSYYLRIQYA